MGISILYENLLRVYPLSCPVWQEESAIPEKPSKKSSLFLSSPLQKRPLNVQTTLLSGTTINLPPSRACPPGLVSWQQGLKCLALPVLCKIFFPDLCCTFRNLIVLCLCCTTQEFSFFIFIFLNVSLSIVRPGYIYSKIKQPQQNQFLLLPGIFFYVKGASYYNIQGSSLSPHSSPREVT